MTERINYVRAVLLPTLLFLASEVILATAFPIWREFRYGRYPKAYWIKVYFESACALVLIYALVAWVCRIVTKRASAVIEAAVFFAVVSSLAVFLGTRTADEQVFFPAILQDIHAKFLAEWQFVKFISTVILPISVLSWLLRIVSTRSN